MTDADVMRDGAVSPAETRFGPLCPLPVRFASQMMRWDDLTFLHWRYPAELVQAMLPSGLTVETFDGSAWVGLVPFEMEVSVPRIGPLPWISHFPETNVRTYVTGPDGTTGVWFLSLDASRLAAVVAARSAYRLPYFWSHMRIGRAGPLRTYTSRRRWPGPVGAATEVAIEIGDRCAPDELTQLDHFLTARWRLYSTSATGLRSAPAEHEPWVLHRAQVRHLDDGLITAAGLPAPEGSPLAHWSPGVEVRIGFPRRCTASPSPRTAPSRATSGIGA